MPTVSSSLAPFYGTVLAEPAFLADQDVYCCFELAEQGYTLFAEGTAAGQPRVYVLDGSAGLYLLDLHKLAGATEASGLTPAKLKRLAPEWLNWPTSLASVGACVAHHGYGGPATTLPYLMGTAMAAAMEVGATKATARWLARLVEAAFLGSCFDYVVRYTNRGLWLGPDAPYQTFVTEKRQLRKLQDLGLVQFSSQRGHSGLTVRFRQAALAPGVAWALAPKFFATLLL